MDESRETLERLQRIIDRSAATAGAAIRRNFVGPGWSMSAAEFVAFWTEGRMASVSTSSEDGAVHAAPLEPRLVDGKFYIPTFPDSQRLRDHRARGRCAIVSWDGPYRAVIVYGVAREVGGDPGGHAADTAAEQGYSPASMITVEVTPLRIYSIRPPKGHHAYSAEA